MSDLRFVCKSIQFRTHHGLPTLQFAVFFQLKDLHIKGDILQKYDLIYI